MGTQVPADCPRSDRRRAIRRALGMPADLAVRTPEATRGRAWTRDGIDGLELTWHCTDARTPTDAWLLRPTGTTADLPAILLLHAHDGVKFYGKEKVADGPGGVAPGVVALRERGYDGTAVAAELVGAGFAVLVHDVFPWGSRRVVWDDFPLRAQRAGSAFTGEIDSLSAHDTYEAAAREHEHGLAKVSALTGTSLAGLVLAEDLAALEILRHTPGIDSSRIAALGFSGGGARVAHLLTSTDALKAAVVSAMTSTFSDIADGHADDTTWLMITPGLPAVCDWPEVVSCNPSTPLLVQFAEQDSHFGLGGMRDAESIIRHEYGESNSVTTQWFSTGHRFTTDMQRAAGQWLSNRVGSRV